MKGTTLYFESDGKANTDATLDVAQKRATELGIRQIVVATAIRHVGPEKSSAHPVLQSSL